ncbi:MAG: NAD(P)H-hydrate dehydratase [Phycisphaerales bacterium]
MRLESLQLPPLPERPDDGHKGTFGTVLVIGGHASGSSVMIGAPAIAATAAFRAGAGLVKIAAPSAVIQSILTIAPSATGLALPADERGDLAPSAAASVIDDARGDQAVSFAIGVGWGVGSAQQQILMRQLADDESPITLDADGLNNLAQAPDFGPDLRAPLILTPHPGEYRRLAAPLSISHDPTDPDQREEAAHALAQRLGCVVVLKTAETIVSDGQRCWRCAARNSAMGTAGTGDVLTGIISSLVAQFWKPQRGRLAPEQQGGLSLYDCARWGVAIHARAGWLWRERHGAAGLTAASLTDEIPGALNEARALGESRATPDGEES